MEKYMDEIFEGATMPINTAVTPEIGLGFGSIHAEKMDDEEAQTFAEIVAGFRREVSMSSPAVCIDGRPLAEGEMPLELGPHIAGGAMTLMVGAKAVNHPFEGAALLTYANKQGFDLRAHCDSTNKNNNFAGGTGCGANDRLPEIGVNFTENKNAVKATTEQLLGDDFDATVMENIQLPMPSIEEWNKNFLKDSVGEDKIENLHDDNEGVHGHKEQMVVFNTLKNTTIDRDALVKEISKQVFVVDLWFIKELANRLATGPNAADQAKQLHHAMVAYQVATYITLCDGSHRAVVLS